MHDDNWLLLLNLKHQKLKVVKEEELAEAKKLMPPEIYEAEYECSFESSAIGAIYSQGLNKAEDESRITKVPYDPTLRFLLSGI